MSFHHFPNDFVFWDTVEKHETIKNELLPEIMKKNEERKNNPFDSSIFNTSFYKDTRMLSENAFLMKEHIIKDVIFKPLTDMIKKYNNLKLNEIGPGISIVQSGWWNLYEKDGFQEMHIHKSHPLVLDDKIFYPSFSVIYILNDENDDSNILFKKDHVPMRKPVNNDYTFKTSNEKNVGEGTVMIFPYDLNHMVRPCKKPGRVTLAYNIFSTWEAP